MPSFLTVISSGDILREMLRINLKENSSQFNGKHYLQIHGTAIGTKTAVSFATVTETVFLDTVVYKGTRFKEKSILDVKTHFKRTETFQYTHFTSCHPPSVKKRFVKGESLRILRTNSPKTTFEENISNFKQRLIDRGYPQTMIKNLLSDIKFAERESALLKHSNKEEKKYCLS